MAGDTYSVPMIHSLYSHITMLLTPDLFARNRTIDNIRSNKIATQIMCMD